MSSHYLTLYRG